MRFYVTKDLQDRQIVNVIDQAGYVMLAQEGYFLQFKHAGAGPLKQLNIETGIPIGQASVGLLIFIAFFLVAAVFTGCGSELAFLSISLHCIGIIIFGPIVKSFQIASVLITSTPLPKRRQYGDAGIDDDRSY